MAEKIDRIIYYYDFDFVFPDEMLDGKVDPVENLIQTIRDIVKSKAKIRYQHFGEKYIYVHDLVYRDTHKLYTGKIRCVRRDLLPELMNTRTDVVRGIEAAEEEGVVETTHFILKATKVKETYEVLLALEFNLFGAKVQDMEYYFRNIGLEKGVLKNLSFSLKPANVTFAELKQQIGAISNIEIKLERDKVTELLKIDKNYFEFANTIKDTFEQEYLHLDLKYNYNHANKKADNFVSKLLDKFSGKKELMENFQVLKVTAMNEESRRKTLEVFDILIDKLKSEVRVEKKKGYRTLVSESMFGEMLNEIEGYGL